VKKKPIFCLTSEEIKEGIRLCYQKVNSLLDRAEALVAQGDRVISSGLYTFAVEELGKLLLLQKALKELPDIKNKISVNPAIFGKGERKNKHPTIKFDEFEKERSIPPACKKLRIVTGGVFTTHHKRAGKTLNPTGMDVITVFIKSPTDFQLRKKIFYVDWEDGEWVKHPDIEIADLQSAIKELRKWMANKIF